jgi:preprotein translocase subunit SecE
VAKVVWPSRREVVTHTIVVILTVLVVGVFVFGLDVLFSRVIVELFDE